MAHARCSRQKAVSVLFVLHEIAQSTSLDLFYFLLSLPPPHHPPGLVPSSPGLRAGEKGGRSGSCRHSAASRQGPARCQTLFPNQSTNQAREMGSRSDCAISHGWGGKTGSAVSDQVVSREQGPEGSGEGSHADIWGTVSQAKGTARAEVLRGGHPKHV